MDLDLVNQQIKDLQRVLAKGDIPPDIRENYYDTLTFLLDTRALLVMKNITEIPKEELN